jgi:fermentation-respiration switch protein FrsA (DUF1100 family)
MHLDYRGYRRKPDAPSENGLVSDAPPARAYVASRIDMDLGRVIYFGKSLGSGVAEFLHRRWEAPSAKRR